MAEYLDYYGFNSEPFVGQGGFFSTAERAEVLDQIEHWCDFGAGIIVLEGPEGVGKTAVLQELARRCGDGALISQLDGPVLAGLDQMLMLLAAELGADLIEGQTSGAMLGHLRKHLKNAAQPMFVLVDQAHNLDDRALLALMGLLQGQQPGEGNLNIVAFAERGLAERLRKFDVADVIVNQKELGPLNESELASYIHQQLASVDYDGPELFSDLELKELYRASRGFPAEVDVLAQNLLVNRLYSSSLKNKGFPIWHLVGVGALMASLGTAYIYRDTIQAMWSQTEADVAVAESNTGAVEKGGEAKRGDNDRARSQELFSSADQAPKASEQAPSSLESADAMADTENLINEALTPSEPLIKSTEKPTSNEQVAQLNEARKVPDSIATEVVTDTAAESSPPVEQVDIGAQTSNVLAGVEGRDVSEPASIEPQADTQASEVAPGLNTDEAGKAEAIALADVNELNDSAVDYSSYSEDQLALLGMDPGFDLSVFTEDEQYLLRLPDSAYVLQLISVRTPEQVEKFLRVQPNRDELKIFNRENNGKSWYVIVQPGFDTWESVQAAQERLPSRRRSGGAWARSLKIIKADIRSFRGI
nr:AAA family ATPase [Pseudoteredinibacter isoporae]